MSNQNRIQPGVSSGGQFTTTARTEPEVELDQQGADPAEEFLASLGRDDRRLAQMLLRTDPFMGTVAPQPDEDAFEELENFSGYGGGDFYDEVERVGRQLTTFYEHHNPGVDAPFLDLDYSEGDGYRGYTVSAHTGRSYVAISEQLDQATHDRAASGPEAAVAIARALDADYQRVLAERQRLSPPSMEQMRAAVQIDTWQRDETKVRFVDGPGGEGEIHVGIMRSGRYADDQGTPARADSSPREGFVRITTSTGFERFVPFRTVEKWVQDHLIAEH